MDREKAKLLETVYCRFKHVSNEETKTGICSFFHKELVGTIWDMYYFFHLGDFHIKMEISESWIGESFTFEPITKEELEQELIEMKEALEMQVAPLTESTNNLNKEQRLIEVKFLNNTLERLSKCITTLTEHYDWVAIQKIEQQDYVPIFKRSL